MRNLIIVCAAVTLLIASSCSPSTPSGAQSTTIGVTPAIVGQTLPLSELYKKLDDVYAATMKPTADEIDPHEKQLVDMLMQHQDGHALAQKDSKLYQEGIQAADQTSAALSSSTSAAVAVTDHDAYVAYFMAIGEKITARQNEYRAILDYAAKPTADNANQVIALSRLVRGKELAYNEVERD